MRDSFEEKFQLLTRKVAAEGIVLLKNQDHILPLTDTDNVSLFGRCQIDYYRSGTGSGGAVNTKYSVNALEGLRNTFINLNEELISIYEDYINKFPFDKGNGHWGSEPWSQKEMFLEDTIVKRASFVSNKAIIFIGRTAGEDKDHYIGKGSLLLTDNELHMIDVVTKYFNKVILIYNVGNVIDMSYLTKYNDSIGSIIYAWQGGMEGGNALADILSGKVNPSGRMPDTLIKDINNHPTNKNFGGMERNFYEEDIYLGYRYFETFAKKQVLYPFGYGLSYTNFETKIKSFKKNSTSIRIEIMVKNIGDVTGMGVIQIYSEAPQGVLGKPFVELIGFIKTKPIEPNSKELVILDIPLYNLSSYDDYGFTGHKSSYVLEAGKYQIYLGKNSRDLMFINDFVIDKTIVLDTLKEALAPLTPFKRIKPGTRFDNGEYEITYANVPLRSVDLQSRLNESKPNDLIYSNQIYTLQDVQINKISIDEFIATLSKEQLALLVLGEGMSHPLVTNGTAAAFGGLYPELTDKGVPATCAADGPSGLRMDTGETSIQMPIGTLIASTWNTSLIEDLYMLEGQELQNHNVDTLLGPGMNIHRNPMCGRNFEYFSEDPLLTGKIASAIVKGIRKGGSEATLKHFAANDQESNRFDVDSIASERCLREIHLKGFEIAVKEANPISIMTAYNPINGHHAASNYDLNTTILRKEWGFDGLVMTDWWAKLNNVITPDKAEKYRIAEMIKSQNDIYMVIPNFETKKSLHYDHVLKNLESGYLSMGELQRSAKNILNFILKSNAVKRKNKDDKIKEFDPLHDYDINNEATSKSIIYNTKVDDTKLLKIEEDKEYTLAVSLKNDSSDLSQSACNILINSKLLTNLQLKGNTQELLKKDIIKVKLSKGFYEVSLKFIRPGIEIKYISFE